MEQAIQTFKSIHHPRGRPTVVVRSQAMMQPLTITMLVLMIYILVDILVGLFTLADLLWGFFFSILAAAILTFFLLRRQVAEVRVQRDYAAVRTTHDVLVDKTPEWGPLYDVRDDDGLLLTVEWGNYELREHEWPNYRQLVSALERNQFDPVR